MRVLLDAGVMEAPFTGIAKVTLALHEACRCLQPGWDVEALHRRPLTEPLPPWMSSIQPGPLRMPNPIWRRLVLPAAIARRAPDIVHFPWNGKIPPILPRCLVVSTLHDVLPLIIPDHFRSDGARRAYRRKTQTDILRSNLVITDSEYSKQQIIQNFRVLSEPVVIYPAVSAAFSAPAQQPAGGGDYFLCVGGYNSPRKRLEPVIRVFTQLSRERRLASRLIMTGTPRYYSEAFRLLVAEGVAMGVIEERGYVCDEALADLLTSATALVYPSQYEGFGLPPLEAMSTGCPVLTSRSTSIPEVCGDAALYVDPDDDQDIARCLLLLDSDPELQDTLRARGRQQAQRFSWAASAHRFLTKIDELVARRQHKRSSSA